MAVNVRITEDSTGFPVMEWTDTVTGVTKSALVLKNNLVAIVNPTINEDTVDGYSEGSLWLNTVTDEFYLCADPATGAAVWREVGGVSGGGAYASATDPVNTNDITEGFNVGSLWVNTTTGGLWVSVDDTTNAAVWTILGPDQTQVLYVGKHGNDAYDGKTPGKAKLTFASAITAAGTPASEAAAFTVVCFDDGEYDENLTCVDYVNLYAPSATLKGRQTLAVMHLTARRMINDGEAKVIYKNSTGLSYVTAEVMYSTATLEPVVRQTKGDLKLDVSRIESTAERAFALWTTGLAFTCDITAKEVIASSDAMLVAGTGGVVTARIGRMSGTNGLYLNDTDEVDAVIGRLICTTAYNVNATSALRLLVGELSGTETAADGADVRVTKAKRDNLVGTTDPAVTDDADDGYTVGSCWYDATNDRWWICSDASVGAAVWERMTVQKTASASTTNADLTSLATIAVPDDTVMLIEATISARRTNAADRAGYIRRALVYREAAGGATLQGLVDTPLTRESALAGVWNATIVVAGNNAIIQVKGQVGHNVNWKTEYRVTQVE